VLAAAKIGDLQTRSRTALAAAMRPDITTTDRAARRPGGARRDRSDVRVLGESTEPLATRYDVALLDLDVWCTGERGDRDAPARAEKAAQSRMMKRAFVTNNASVAPEAVAERLRKLGVPAEPDDVITSAQTAATCSRTGSRPAPGCWSSVRRRSPGS